VRFFSFHNKLKLSLATLCVPTMHASDTADWLETIESSTSKSYVVAKLPDDSLLLLDCFEDRDPKSDRVGTNLFWMVLPKDTMNLAVQEVRKFGEVPGATAVLARLHLRTNPRSDADARLPKVEWMSSWRGEPCRLLLGITGARKRRSGRQCLLHH
jgi:hypothetical protein